MKRLIVFAPIASLVVCFGLAYAQPDSLWSKTYGGVGTDYSISLCPAHDEGYIMQCSSNGTGNEQVWIIKTDAQGDSVWGRVYGGTQDDSPGNVGKTSDGGYFFTGYTRSSGAGSSDFWLVKMDSEGQQVWSRTYGGTGEEHCYWGQQTPDGGFILAGETESFGNANYDVWVLKVNADGDSMWSHQYGGDTADAGGTYVSLTADGGYIVSGVTRPAGSPVGQFWLIKLQASGATEWSHTYGDEWDDVPWCVTQCCNGEFVAIGNSTRSNGMTDAWLLKTTINGDSLWGTYVGELDANEIAFTVIEAADGGYVIGGQDALAGGNVMLVRTDFLGTVQWTGSYGGTSVEAAYQVLATPDGGYLVGGGTMSFGAGDVDVWLLKTGPDPLFAVDPRSPVPVNFGLSVFPNPFNPATTVRYRLDSPAQVVLRVFDIQGRAVATLGQGLRTAGEHTAVFTAEGLPSGSYFVRLHAVGAEQTAHIVLLR